MGASTKSGTPTETRRATASAGESFNDLWRVPLQEGDIDAGGIMGMLYPGGPSRAATYEEVVGRVGDMMGRLGTESQQNQLGFSTGDLDLLSAAQAVLNPQRFDATTMFDLLQTQRDRQMNSAQRGAAATAGTAGMRFSGNADRAVRNTGSELGREFALQDETLLAQENARVQQQQMQGFAAVLQALLNAGGQGQQATLGALQQILQFISPGEPIYDPGLGRELIGAAAGAVPILAMGGGGGTTNINYPGANA